MSMMWDDQRHVKISVIQCKAIDFLVTKHGELHRILEERSTKTGQRNLHKFHIYIHPCIGFLCRYLLNHCVGVESSTGTLTLMADQVGGFKIPCFGGSTCFQVIHSMNYRITWKREDTIKHLEMHV